MENVNTRWWILNCPAYQFGSWVVPCFCPSWMSSNNHKVGQIKWTYIFKWRFRCRRRCRCLSSPILLFILLPANHFVHTDQGDNFPLSNKNNSNRQINFAMQPYKLLTITLLLFHSLELVDHWFERILRICLLYRYVSFCGLILLFLWLTFWYF